MKNVRLQPIMLCINNRCQVRKVRSSNAWAFLALEVSVIYHHEYLSMQLHINVFSQTSQNHQQSFNSRILRRRRATHANLGARARAISGFLNFRLIHKPLLITIRLRHRNFLVTANLQLVGSYPFGLQLQ